MTAARIAKRGSKAAPAVTVDPAVTDWYAGEQRPVREGVYQRQINILSPVTFSYWNGEYWCCYANSAFSATAYTHMSSNFQCAPWRGLASDPSKKAP